MNTEEANHILTRLEIGSRIDAEHLKELAEGLFVSLQAGRDLGARQELLEASYKSWQRNWDKIEKILSRTRVLMNEMTGGLESHEADHLKRATAAWEAIQCEGDQLQETLEPIRVQASGLKALDRKQWNLLAHTLEAELEAMHFCAQALRIKLELQKSNGNETAERLVRHIVSKLPKLNQPDGLEDALYDHEFRTAITELQREQHEFLSCMDVVNGLLLWSQTPDERMRMNRSLSIGI